MSSASLTISVQAEEALLSEATGGGLSDTCVQCCEIPTSGDLASPWVLCPFPDLGFLFFGALSAERSNPSITL